MIQDAVSEGFVKFNRREHDRTESAEKFCEDSSRGAPQKAVNSKEYSTLVQAEHGVTKPIKPVPNGAICQSAFTVPKSLMINRKEMCAKSVGEEFGTFSESASIP